MGRAGLPSDMTGAYRPRRRGLLRDSPNPFDRAKGYFLDLILIAFLVGIAIKGSSAFLDWMRS